MQGRKIVEQDWMEPGDYDATIRNLAEHSPRPVKVTFYMSIKTGFMTVERMEKVMRALRGLDEDETQVKVRVTATFEDSMQMRLFAPEGVQGEFEPERFLGNGVTEVHVEGEEDTEEEVPYLPNARDEEEQEFFNEAIVCALVDDVAKYYDMSPSEITGASRLAPIVKARHVVMYLLHADMNYSYSEIGRLMDRDPASVTHAVTKIAGELHEESGDAGTRVDVRNIRNYLADRYDGDNLGTSDTDTGTTEDKSGIEEPSPASV